MAGQFTGKVVMVTGAAGNVGRGVLGQLWAEDAKIVMLDRTSESCEQTVEDMGNAVGDYLAVAANIGDVSEMDTVLEKTINHYGQFDALIHTAGGFAMGTPVHEDDDLSVYDKMMFLNTKLTYVALGRAARLMLSRGTSGALVAILAKPALAGAANMAPYSASKAAAQRIVESMAAELKPHNIRVNGIMPSIVDTPPNRASMPNADFDKWVTPDQIGRLAAFLASDVSDAISGASVPIYGKV